MRKYWTEERFSYDGEIFQLDDVWMNPKPVQPGGPPIWLAGRSSAAITRAARQGDGYMPYMYTARGCREAFAEVRARPRSSRSTSARLLRVHLRLRQHGRLGRACPRAGDSRPFVAVWQGLHPLDRQVLRPRDAGDVRGSLREFVDVGIEHLALGMIHEECDRARPGAVPDASRDARDLERYARELLPALRGEGAHRRA